MVLFFYFSGKRGRLFFLVMNPHRQSISTDFFLKSTVMNCNSNPHNNHTDGGVGYISNERGFSVESSLHRFFKFVVETKRFVGRFVNVNLTRQTSSQLSSRAAEGKCRALGNYFSERSCYMFLISKCTRD